jgi:hypothetical protein
MASCLKRNKRQDYNYLFIDLAPPLTPLCLLPVLTPILLLIYIMILGL